MRLKALVGLALFGAAGAAEAQVAPKMPEQVKHCENRDGTFDSEDVIRSCNAIFEAPGATQGERYSTLMYRIIAELRANNATVALADLDKALPLATTAREMAQINLHRAYAFAALNRQPEAGAELERAIKADPTYPPALQIRGSSNEGKGRYREALADYDVINADNSYPQVLNSACWIRAAKLNAELDKALRDCNSAIYAAPKVASYYDSRGMVNLRQKEFDAAFKDYDTAVRLDPKKASSLYGRAVAAMAIGRSGDADIAAAKALDPKVADTYAAMGLAAGSVKGPAVAVVGQLSKPTVYDWGDPVLAKRVESCGYYRYIDASSYALAHRQGHTKAQVDADFAKRIPDDARIQASCLRGLKGNYPAKRQLIEQAALNSPADLDAAYRIGHAEFFANPVKYMWPGNPELKDYSAATMRSDLIKFKQFKTFEQVCGTFDTSMPSSNNAAINRRDAERMAYSKCAEHYRDTVWDQVPGSAAFHFESARTELDSFAPYVCSRYKVAGCIPDSRWREFDSIATPSNVAFVKRIDDMKSPEKDKANDAIGVANKWLEDVNAMVARYNSRH